jgi:hypothetical protein
VIDHYLGSTTSASGVAPRAPGVPPPLPGREEPKAPPVADGKASGKTPSLPGKKQKAAH